MFSSVLSVPGSWQGQGRGNGTTRQGEEVCGSRSHRNGTAKEEESKEAEGVQTRPRMWMRSMRSCRVVATLAKSLGTASKKKRKDERSLSSYPQTTFLIKNKTKQNQITVNTAVKF